MSSSDDDVPLAVKAKAVKKSSSDDDVPLAVKKKVCECMYVCMYVCICVCVLLQRFKSI